MLDIAKMEGEALDQLVAEKVMGWSCLESYWLNASGAEIASRFNWHPSAGKKLSAAASDVLLKALADGYRIIMETPECLDGLYRVGVRLIDGNIWFANASTLPRALCEAVVAAYEMKK